MASKSKPINEQFLQDEIKQRLISEGQRRYMKCSNGKCIANLTEEDKLMRRIKLRSKKRNFICRNKGEGKFKRIFIERGRVKRIESLEKEVHELDLRLNAARGKLYLKENEENFKKISENLEVQKNLAVEIEKAKMEISHLKSQFERLDKKMEDLKKETESECELSLTSKFLIRFYIFL